MKKLALAFCMLAGLYACSTMDAPEPAATAPSDSAPVTSIVRTPEEARTLAAEAFANFYGTSRSLAHIKNVRTFTAAPPSRSGAATDTTFYVVNLDDNQGYAVIAARRDIEPVLAVTESGNIESIDSIENPGAKIFFDCLSIGPATNLNPIDSSTIIIPNPGWPGGDVNPWINTTQYKTDVKTEDDDIEPRIQLQWGQEMPEGIYFENKIAGCGNTACALLLSYFEQPKWISSSKFGTISIDWTIIKEHKKSYWGSNIYDNCGNLESASHQALAKLCYSLGEMNKSKCKEESTSTSLENIYSTLYSFRTLYYNPRPIQTGIPEAHKDLGSGIILVVAYTTEGEGHVFLMDGCKYNTTTIIKYKRDPGAKDWDEIARNVEIRSYNHINWGWNGCDNGYFKHDVFNVADANEYDNNSHVQDQPNFVRKFNYIRVIKE